MKIQVELYGACKEFSQKNIVELNLKKNSNIKDLRKELIKFIKIKHSGNKNFCQIVESSAFCSEDNNIIHDEFLILNEQKISIIPPIAGG